MELDRFPGGRPLRVPPERRAPSMAIGNELGRVGGSGEAYFRILRLVVHSPAASLSRFQTETPRNMQQQQVTGDRQVSHHNTHTPRIRHGAIFG